MAQSPAKNKAAQAAAPKIDCICRFNGQDFHVGQTACLRSPNGPQLARCDMVLNNTSWKFTGTSCHISALPPDGLSRVLAQMLPPVR